MHGQDLEILREHDDQVSAPIAVLCPRCSTIWELSEPKPNAG